MVSLPDFKKALGPLGDKLTEKEIERLNILSAQLAGSLFNMWSRKLKESRQNEKPIIYGNDQIRNN